MKSLFPGTEAPFATNLLLLVEIAMGVGLLLGARFARKKQFREHAWCQSGIVILNLVVIAAVMIPSFHETVLPKIPAHLGRSYYALATAHGVFGVVAEVFALYILFSAGLNVLPEALRIKNYKLWMRSVLSLWWVALLLGIATYTRWYIPHLFSR